MKTLVTNDLLEDVERYALDKYTLVELFEELDISMELLQDKQILEAFNKGLEENYILYKVDGMSDEDIISDYNITAEQCLQWNVKHSSSIMKQKEDKEKQIKLSTRQFSDPLTSGIISILTQNGASEGKVSAQQTADDICEMVKKMQNGDTTDFLTMLVTNNLQLQSFNQTITRNITGDAGKQIDNYEILSKMQMRVMSETRRNIMAMNAICNPKQATFIKEANQHNHLHQENSQKKLENENELQKVEQLEAPAVATDTEIIPLKDKV